MYFAHITLVSVFFVVTEQATFNKVSHGITNINAYPVSGLGPAYTVIWFHINSISYIPSSFFLNLQNLDELWLHQNVITDIADFAFQGVPSVTYIPLYDNRLTIIRR